MNRYLLHNIFTLRDEIVTMFWRWGFCCCQPVLTADRLEPGALLLWGDRADRCSTVPPHEPSIQVLIKCFSQRVVPLVEKRGRLRSPKWYVCRCRRQVSQDVALTTGDTGFILKLLEAAGDIFFNSCQDREKAITFYRVQAESNTTSTTNTQKYVSLRLTAPSAVTPWPQRGATFTLVSVSCDVRQSKASLFVSHISATGQFKVLYIEHKRIKAT